ncbi:MAG TPA: DUF6279 family lipoprotein [bacterium]|nr:DUF6279 family lipoprotein [bacterium]HPS28631.1 DUF6279 family lipoprotein [bacterium]
MKKLIFLVIFAGLLMTNFSCSTSVKLAYNNADFFILKTLNDVGCLDSEQKKTVKQEVKSFMAWHRKQELPVYVKNMREFGKALRSGPITQSDFEKMYVFFMHTQQKTTDQIKNFAVDFAMSMPVSQVECAFTKLEKGGEERKKELAEDRDKYYKKMKKEMVKQTKTVLGSVTDEQIAMIDTIVPPLEEEIAANQATKRKRDYLKSVFLRPPTDEKRNELMTAISSPDSIYTDTEKKLIEKRLERAKEGLWKLTQTFTEKQRKYLADTLFEYAEKFEELSQE